MYTANRPLYGVDWTGPEGHGAVAVSSLSEEATNVIEVIERGRRTAECSIPYPATRIRWMPIWAKPALQLISCGDCLRLWDYQSGELQLACSMVNKLGSGHLPPQTALDWNRHDTSRVVVSSVDTTCTLWDVHTTQARTQLIAHDSEVYDVAFVANSIDVFASVGADGSVRVFDLRALDHSTIIYEPADAPPLVRLAVHPADSARLAVVAADASVVHVLDTRMPGTPLTRLAAHHAPVCSLQWAPVPNAGASHLLATAADDAQILLWDLNAYNDTVIGKVVSRHSTVPEPPTGLAWAAHATGLAYTAGRRVSCVFL